MLKRLLVAALALAGVAAAQDPPSLVGRLSYVRGSVSFQPGRTQRSPANEAAGYAGDQGVRQVADGRVSRSDPGFEMYAALPLACRVASDEIWLRQ